MKKACVFLAMLAYCANAQNVTLSKDSPNAYNNRDFSPK